ncbi:hypothetical protein LEP1GSC073_2087 [Leptospira noguchii str. Cascata]|nr:hypothetical protein LEP1GSC072_0778 [Leptospira noguchii str. Bonito]EMN00946.1 hypothetical protein LEP1GSC035_4971 [Leptospira noguchii str. 2007001578]EMO39110.1 hypothetical protein LEP1GSC186_2832 [Leptospira noguchii serovar Autumnalis str. ZUN142]EMS89602.1 hypothetical protein LEP1GSC073_2087 [Leptospira noguchii str. Cascata]
MDRDLENLKEQIISLVHHAPLDKNDGIFFNSQRLLFFLFF